MSHGSQSFSKRSMAQNARETSAKDTPESGRTLGVESFLDMNLHYWRRWGFDLEETLRTPKYHFLLNPRRSALLETAGEEPMFTLEGEWYRQDEAIEERIRKTSWSGYLLLLLMFAGMLQAVWARMGLVAAVLFVLMYITMEGLMPLLLRSFAAHTRSDRVDIPWVSLTRVILIPRPGILLLGWQAEESRRGIALKLQPDAARDLFDRLRGALPEGVKARVVDSGSLASPPSNLK